MKKFLIYIYSEFQNELKEIIKTDDINDLLELPRHFKDNCQLYVKNGSSYEFVKDYEEYFNKERF